MKPSFPPFASIQSYFGSMANFTPSSTMYNNNFKAPVFIDEFPSQQTVDIVSTACELN